MVAIFTMVLLLGTSLLWVWSMQSQPASSTVQIALVRVADARIIECCGPDPLTMMGSPNQMPEWPEVAKNNTILHLKYCYEAEITNNEDTDIAITLIDVSIVNTLTGKIVPYKGPTDITLDRNMRVPARQTRRFTAFLLGLIDASCFSPGYYRLTALFYSYTTKQTYTSDTIRVLITSKDIRDYNCTHGYGCK